LFKSSLFIILFISLSGYLYLSRSYKWRYRLKDYQGHHLLYRVLQFGISFYFVGTVVFLIGHWLTNDSDFFFSSMKLIYPAIERVEYNFVIISFNAIVAAHLYTNHINYQCKKDFSDNVVKTEMYWRFESTDSDIVKHILESYFNQNLLLISLDNRKCYVCVVNEFNGSNDHSNYEEMTIVPLYSGYRDEKTLSLKNETKYTEVVEAFKTIEDEKIPSDSEKNIKAIQTVKAYKVTLSLSKILTVANFDLQKYKVLQKSRITDNQLS
jgi:hypothetical protein